MGHILNSVGNFVAICLVTFAVLVFLPGLPPDLEFTAFSVTPALPLEGPLALNEKLNKAEQLFKGQVKGAECFAIHDGDLYTGTHGGWVMKIVGDKLIPVVKFGEGVCDGFWDEPQCGRPLGMKSAKDGFLYVCDAYFGVHKVNTKTGKSTLLVSKKVPINGKKPMLPNSVDVASDGMVYWTDSSADTLLEDGVYALLGDGSGRLLQYDPKTNQSVVLIDKLHFANGVVLSPKEDFVLVAETVRSRIRRYYLKGPKKGTADIFLDGIPGMPDNLKSNGRGGFYVPTIVARDVNNTVLPQRIAGYPLLRKFLARFMGIIELIFKQINAIYPNYYCKRAAHWIGHFESVTFLSPLRMTVLDVDINGKIQDSLHCLDGSLHGISEIEVFKGYYYFGSPYNDFIGRVKIQK